MTFGFQKTMRLAAILALTAASASAFAQSSEYRRGYEDGFAAGQRASHDDRERGPGWGRVHVEEAMYGVRGAMCDARDAVRSQLERNEGVIRVNNELCGDPARHERKRLTIVYRCRGTDAARAVATEGETLRLSCRR